MKVFRFNHTSFFFLRLASSPPCFLCLLFACTKKMHGEIFHALSCVTLFHNFDSTNKRSKIIKLTMVVSFLRFPSILKVCCCVCMLLLLLLNDCVSFSWDCGAALDRNRLIIHFLIGCRRCCCCYFNRVHINSIHFLHFWLSSLTKMSLLMLLLIVMGFWFSGDVFGLEPPI
jgi:hypothetical protein